MAQTASKAALMTVEQVAKRLGVSINWVYASARHREIECVRVGGALRFRPEAVDEYIDEHTSDAL